MNIQSVSTDYKIPFIGLATVNHLVLQLNGGKIGYDTFRYRMLQERGLVLPHGLDTHNVLIHLLGDAQPEDDGRGSKRLMINIRFVFYDPRPYIKYPDNREPDARIKIITDNGEKSEYAIAVGERGLGWLVTAMEALIVEQCESIKHIQLGVNKGGLAHEWMCGSRRILYRNVMTGDETYIAFPWNKSSVLYRQMDIQIEETYFYQETSYDFNRIKVNDDGMIVVWCGVNGAQVRFQKPIDKGWYRINPDGYTSSIDLNFGKRLHKLVSDYANDRAGID